MAFYRKNRELYLGTEDVAAVGVLRSHASLTYHHARAQLSAILTEQALIQSRVPFHLIFDEPLPDLARLRVLILPDSECLSDEQLATHSRLCRKRRRLGGDRSSGSLRRMAASAGRAGVERVGRRAGRRPPITRRTWGECCDRGTCSTETRPGKEEWFTFPAWSMTGRFPKPSRTSTSAIVFGNVPRTGSRSLTPCVGRRTMTAPLRVYGPDFLVANLVEQAARQRRLIHLVNYDARNTPRFRLCG